eukprot:4879312-Amphidinium_carterae.2
MHSVPDKSGQEGALTLGSSCKWYSPKTVGPCDVLATAGESQDALPRSPTKMQTTILLGTLRGIAKRPHHVELAVVRDKELDP